MSEECTHDCGSCSANCGERKEEQQYSKNDNNSGIEKIIAVVSGKGGVGKTLVTSLLATEAKKQGKSVALLDADITGPSIPKAFGIKEKASGSETGIFPVQTKSGIDVMSINLLLDNVTDPVVWRGPVISGTVSQFYTDVIWGKKDIMFIDMPPGTGDVPLTVFQSMPIDGIIIVTSPQDLVSMIVEKAMNMAKLMNIPVIGLIENMSFFECECGRIHQIFGESHSGEIAERFKTPLLLQLPFSKELAGLSDSGEIEKANTNYFENVVKNLF